MNPSYRYPLAHDLDGEPIQLPPEAIAWRVRRRSGKQGRPQCVYHHETGAQLVIPLDATVEALVPYGPAVYRLDAIDADAKVIPGVVAYTEVPRQVAQPEADEDRDDGSPTEREQLQLIRQLVESNVRVMEAMASAFGKVRPVDDAPERGMVQPPVAASPGKSGSQEVMEIFQQCMPMLPYLKQAWDYLRGGGANPFVGSGAPVDGGVSDGGAS